VGEPPPGPAADPLASKLAEARKRLAELDLPAAEAARLHRRFIAVCDAVKARGGGDAGCERRLSAFLAALDRASAKSDPRI
jgi:hypothetical protein